MIALGANTLSAAKLGASSVTKIMLGTSKLWPTASAASWVLAGTINTAVTEAASFVNILGQIVVMGGRLTQDTTTGSVSDEIQLYMASTQQSSLVANDLSVARYGTWATQVLDANSNQLWYILGGRINSGATVYGGIDYFSPDNECFSSGTAMPIALSHVAGALINRVIYISGGREDYGNAVSGTYAYDVDTDTWTTKTSGFVTRQSASTGYNGKMYVLGGYASSFLSTFKSYNPATNTWMALTDAPIAVISAGLCASNGKIYLIGGQTSAGYTNACYCYDIATNSWSAMPSLLEQSMPSFAHVINGSIYIVGGSNGTAPVNTVQKLTL